VVLAANVYGVARVKVLLAREGVMEAGLVKLVS
jgi:hypothetical protein